MSIDAHARQAARDAHHWSADVDPGESLQSLSGLVRRRRNARRAVGAGFCTLAIAVTAAFLTAQTPTTPEPAQRPWIGQRLGELSTDQLGTLLGCHIAKATTLPWPSDSWTNPGSLASSTFSCSTTYSPPVWVLLFGSPDAQQQAQHILANFPIPYGWSTLPGAVVVSRHDQAWRTVDQFTSALRSYLRTGTPPPPGQSLDQLPLNQFSKVVHACSIGQTADQQVLDLIGVTDGAGLEWPYRHVLGPDIRLRALLPCRSGLIPVAILTFDSASQQQAAWTTLRTDRRSPHMFYGQLPGAIVVGYSHGSARIAYDQLEAFVCTSLGATGLFC